MLHEDQGRKDNTGFGPVWGCVLIGGRSSRMGRPKHLLEVDGLTWLELIAGRLRERTEQVVISGGGHIPMSLRDYPVVPDIAGMEGPLAGILAVFRRYPGVSWLVAACDMPGLTASALEWLLEQRGPGVRAVLPDLHGNGLVEPLLAYYDQSCRELLEETVAEGSPRPGRLAGKPGIRTPRPPAPLHSSWRNINSPDELKG